jgi:hypothetical protein
MIFHYPGPLFNETDTGEKKRPKKMLEAFQALNYEITTVIGTYAQREFEFQKIKSNLKSFDFIYSENSNLPLATTGKTKFPNSNSIDHQLFKLAHKDGISTGVFIRDIFWLLKETVLEKGFFKRYIGKRYFLKELNLYFENCTTIFIPTQTFKNYLPKNSKIKFELLPPGAEAISFTKEDPKSVFNLIYVGSCKPPVYQVINCFKNLLKCKNIHLTIVTREKEHNGLKSILGVSNKNLSIVTASDTALSMLLQKQDMGLACVDSNEYWDLAMPLKIFDYIGHQLPILTYQNGETAELIKKNQLGWVISNANEIESFFTKITSKEITQKSNCVKTYLVQNTWLDRAKAVVKINTKKS